MKRQQWKGWGPGEPAQQHYLIQPRALAGGGDVRHVSAFLVASGWRDKSKWDGRLFLENPDRTVRVIYDPFAVPGGWMIRSAATDHQDAWWAQLGTQVPVEILAGLTDALTRPRSAHAPNVWAPLQEHGWLPAPEAKHVTATSPDGSAWMQYRQPPGGEAMWWCGAKDGQGNGWTAQLTASTPMHLVQAFSTALASPDPVMRPLGRVPHSTRLQTTSVSVLPSQLSAWQQARITAAREATWARNSATKTRPRTTTRPHAPAGGTRARR